MTLEPHTPSQSTTVLSQVMEIGDSNLANNVHGGVIRKLCDAAAMDEMSFIEPVFLGEILTLRAQVNDVGRTSMEVGVRVEAENVRTGEKRHVSSAYLVFVALDRDGQPKPVPPLAPETVEEKRRMEEAKIRRQHRLARKEAILARRSRDEEA